MLFFEKHSRNGHVNLYTTLVWVSGGYGFKKVFVFFNNKVGCLIFSVVPAEF